MGLFVGCILIIRRIKNGGANMSLVMRSVNPITKEGTLVEGGLLDWMLIRRKSLMELVYVMKFYLLFQNKKHNKTKESCSILCSIYTP